MLNDAPPLALSLHMAIVGLVLSALVMFAGAGFQPPADQTGWLFFAVCAVGFSGGFLGVYRGVQLIGPLPASMLMNLEPVVTTGLAFLLLGEPLTPQKLIGAAIVVAAVLVSQWLSFRQPSAAISG